MKLFAEAAEDFSSAINEHDSDAGLYFNRGNAHYSVKKYDLALPDYQKAIELDSDNPVYFHHQGLAYQVEKKEF